MQELEQPLERRRRRGSRVHVALVEAPLHRLGVPVAEVVEGQVVQLVDEMGEVELVQQPLELPLRLREPRENPVFLESAWPFRRGRALACEDDQPRDVPELVRELASFVDRTFRKADILRGRHLHQPVAHGVGAVCLDDGKRVHARAQTLRHTPAGRRMHRRVDDDIRERDIAHHLESRENHSVLPEADDVPGGRVQVAWIEGP